MSSEELNYMIPIAGMGYMTLMIKIRSDGLKDVNPTIRLDHLI